MVRLSEVTHSVFYAPQYVGHGARASSARRGLEVELTQRRRRRQGHDRRGVRPGGHGPGRAVRPPSTFMNQGKEDHPVIFAQLTKRDGSFLVGRERGPSHWEDLRGRTIIGGRAGGVPEMTLEYVLRQHGLEPQVDVIVDTSVSST